MSKLDPAFKAKWVAALRSGEFRQTRGKLCDNAGHCCIGVAVDVLKGPGAAKRLDFSAGYWSTADAAIELRLTQDERIHLVRLNDECNKSFPEIADYIEAHL